MIKSFKARPVSPLAFEEGRKQLDPRRCHGYLGSSTEQSLSVCVRVLLSGCFLGREENILIASLYVCVFHVLFKLLASIQVFFVTVWHGRF